MSKLSPSHQASLFHRTTHGGISQRSSLWPGILGPVSKPLSGVFHPLILHVSTRMVETRILKWNLHKKLQSSEMRTALQILGSDRSKWRPRNSQILVRGRPIDFDEIIRYFRRRGIRDPVVYVTTAAHIDFEVSPHVMLISLDDKGRSYCSDDPHSSDVSTSNLFGPSESLTQDDLNCLQTETTSEGLSHAIMQLV